MNKLKTIILDFLPIIVYVIWVMFSVAGILLYNEHKYLVYSIPIIGAVCFIMSDRYHTKYLKNKFKEKYNE